MRTTAEAILIRTCRALLAWGWNACHYCNARPFDDWNSRVTRTIVPRVGRNLLVWRSIVVGPADARHAQIGERPQQEEQRYALPPNRAVSTTLHLNRYDT